MQPIEVPTTRSRSSEARLQSGRDRVVIVGGYGAVGKVVAATLAERGVPVTIAGRDLRRAQELACRHPEVMTARRVDVDQADELDSVLHGAAVVVMCVERRNEQVARACLERGIHVVDISATPAVLDSIERLDTVTGRAGATAVLSVGLAPGLTNVLARWCVARLPSATSVDISILLGLAGDHGPDSARWTMDNLTSRERWGAGRRRVTLPGFGRRTVHPFPFSDQRTLTRTLGIPVTTRVCFDSAAVTAALFGLRATGVLRVLGRLGASAALASASARLRVGGDRFVIHARATDSNSDSDSTNTSTSTKDSDGDDATDSNSTTDSNGATDSDRRHVAVAVTGRQECRATAVVTAQVVEQLLRQPPPAGVWHIDQVVEADAFLRGLREYDLTIHDDIEH